MKTHFETRSAKGWLVNCNCNRLPPNVLKLILNVVMDVEDLSLHLLVQSLQTLRVKDIEGENVATFVSYLKVALLLLKNCADLPTDTHEILNDIVNSASNDDFTGYMRSIYRNQKRSKKGFDLLNYLKVAEGEYMSVYRSGK